MGKKDKKNNPALKAKKEAKADKSALKRLRKEAGIIAEDGGEQQKQDLDCIISSFTKLDVSHPIIEHVSGFPSPRANFSLTVLPNNDVLMYGGEYFNGAENIVFDDMFQWSPDAKNSADSSSSDEETNKDNCDTGKSRVVNQGEWKCIVSPAPRPKPRCAHSAVLYNGDIYVFGGELASLDQFHHYRDFWKYSSKTHLWTLMEPRTPGPSARSGHRCIVWRHYMIVFGGFHEALRETPRWFNDLWIYDFSENLWTECKYSRLASMPDARSGFIFGLHGSSDTAFIYGGFSKVKNPGDIAEGKIHTDCWTLNLKPILIAGGIPSWNRASRKGEFPSARSSMSGIVHKHRLVVCGGVFDEERDHHVVSSLFYDDMFALDMEKRRWFKMNMNKSSAKKTKRNKTKERGGDEYEASTMVAQDAPDSDDDDDDDNSREGEAESSGWGFDELKAHMFAFDEANEIRLNDNIPSVNENNSGKDDDYTADKCGYVNEEKEGYSDEEEETKQDSATAGSIRPTTQNLPLSGDGKRTSVMAAVVSSRMNMTQRNSAPLPRIKPALVLRNNTLYLYGGLLEVGAREVTLDDVWSLDLQKRQEWVCIYEGTMNQHEWKGAESDSESCFSSSLNDDENNTDDDYGEDDDDLADEEGMVVSKIESLTKAPQVIKRDERRKKSDFHAEMERLTSELELNDVNCTPLVRESLADFYARTSKFWTHEASTSIVTSLNTADAPAEKELKKIGFDLARGRFLDMKPILDRIKEVSAQLENEIKAKKKETTAHSVIKQDRKHRAK